MEKPCIMVVDDKEIMLKLIEANLSAENYQVVTADSGNDAIELFEKTRPDLVLLDIMLPDLNGISVLKIIRHYSNVPVIMLTALSETTAVSNALSLGADDYITKPFSVVELSARVKAKLRRTVNTIN